MAHSPDDARRLLCALGDHIRDVVVGARGIDMAVIEGETVADTIYAIDRVADDTLLDWFEQHWPDVEVVSEGLDEPVVVGARPDVDRHRRHHRRHPRADVRQASGVVPRRRGAARRLVARRRRRGDDRAADREAGRGRPAQRDAGRRRRSRSGSTCATDAAHRSRCGRRRRPTSSTGSPVWRSSSCRARSRWPSSRRSCSRASGAATCSTTSTSRRAVSSTS